MILLVARKLNSNIQSSTEFQNQISITYSKKSNKISYPYSYKQFRSELKRLFLRKERFIIIFLSLKNHANILILDTHIKEICHFEPHGIENNKKLYNMLEVLFHKIDPEIKLIKSNKYLPINGYQNIEGIHNLKFKSMKQSDPKGFCYYWCMYFMSQRLKFPDKSWKQLVEQNLGVLFKNTGKKLDFRRHIRNWSQDLERKTQRQFQNIINLDSDGEVILTKLFLNKIFITYQKTFTYLS